MREDIRVFLAQGHPGSWRLRDTTKSHHATNLTQEVRESRMAAASAWEERLQRAWGGTGFIGSLEHAEHLQMS